jgi:hypothetical protein
LRPGVRAQVHQSLGGLRPIPQNRHRFCIKGFGFREVVAAPLEIAEFYEADAILEALLAGDVGPDRERRIEQPARRIILPRHFGGLGGALQHLMVPFGGSGANGGIDIGGERCRSLLRLHGGEGNEESRGQARG